MYCFVTLNETNKRFQAASIAGFMYLGNRYEAICTFRAAQLKLELKAECTELVHTFDV